MSEKKKWRVSAEVTISVGTVVEAESEEKAREIALAREMSNSFRDDGDEDEQWTHDALDGVPAIVSIEEHEDE